MGCLVSTQTTFPSFTTAAFLDDGLGYITPAPPNSNSTDVLRTDVEYQWGPNLQATTVLPGAGKIHRFHYVSNTLPGGVFSGYLNINTITAPVAGDGSSRIVTFVAKYVDSPYRPIVFTHLFLGGNISMRDSTYLGLYPGESITFAWHAGDARWYEIERNLHAIMVSNRSGAALAGVGGSEGTPQGPIAILPTILFDGGSEFTIRIWCAFGGAVDLTSAGYLALMMDGVSIGRVLAADHAPNRQNVMLISHTWFPLPGAHTFTVAVWGTAGFSISLPAHTGPGGPGDIVNSQVTFSRTNA